MYASTKKKSFAIEKQSTIHIFTEWMCGLLVFLTFIQYTDYFPNNMFVFAGKLGLSVYLWCYYFLAIKWRKKEFLIIFSMVIYITIFSIAGNGSYQVVLVYLPIACYLIKKKRMNTIVWTIVCTLIIVLILSAWIKSPNKYYLFSSMSRNYVSVFLIFCFSLFVIKLEKENKNCPIVVVILLWIGCTSALGRGGIISASIILTLFGIKWAFANDKKKNKKFYFRIIFIFAIFIIMLYFVLKNLSYIETTFFGRFFGSEVSASESSIYRQSMYLYYIRSCLESFRTLFLGVDVGNINLIQSNLHNSFLQTHYQFGLIGLLFVIIGSIKSFVYMYRNKKRELIFVYIGVLVRSATDWCFPAFPMEIILLYFLLLPMLDYISKTNRINTKKVI